MTRNDPPEARLAAAEPRPDLPAAVLWDLDGTLVDTEPFWIREERDLVESAGGTWTDADAHACVGNPLLTSAEYIRARSPVDLPPLEIVDRLQSRVIAQLRRHVPWRPGARELLVELHGLGVPCALVTMSWRPMVDAILEHLEPGLFSVVVTGDVVTHGKPHPEPYLTAASALGVEVAACVAVEDSATGAASALASGARTIVVPHVVDVPHTPGLTRLTTLDGVGARELLTLTTS